MKNNQLMGKKLKTLLVKEEMNKCSDMLTLKNVIKEVKYQRRK